MIVEIWYKARRGGLYYSFRDSDHSMERDVVDYLSQASQESALALEALSFEDHAIHSIPSAIEQNEVKPPRFCFSRKLLFAVIVLCYLFPFAMMLLNQQENRFDAVFFLVTLACLSFLLFVVTNWEKKLQYSVAHLVKIKVKKITEEINPIKPFQLKELQNKLEAYQNEVKHLTTELSKQESGYQHQIDLVYSSLEKTKTSMQEISFELERKIEEVILSRQEAEDVHREYERLKSEFEVFCQDSDKQLQHKDSLLQEYQRTITEQRKVLEKKHQTIQRLESRIQDLMYEIRSLLKLEEATKIEYHTTNPTLSIEFNEEMPLDEWISYNQEQIPWDDAKEHLNRYIHITQNFTGLSHLASINSKSSRVLDLAIDNNALDWRGLFDNFRDEPYVIFVYSPLEQKMLFVNGQIKNLLGWAPEKFIKDFNLIIEGGFEEWNKSANDLTTKNSFNLIFKTKEGTERPTVCHLQKIFKGPFSSYIIGILI